MKTGRQVTVGGWVTLLRLLGDLNIPWDGYGIYTQTDAIPFSRRVPILVRLPPRDRVVRAVLYFSPGNALRIVPMYSRGKRGETIITSEIQFEPVNGRVLSAYAWFSSNKTKLENLLVYGKIAPSCIDKVLFHLAPARYWREIFNGFLTLEAAH